MNKGDLIDALEAQFAATKHPIVSHAQTARIVDAVFDIISKECVEGREVAISGFGTFKTGDQKARQARNVATGETVDVPAKRVPRFHASAKFKKAVNDAK